MKHWPYLCWMTAPVRTLMFLRRQTRIVASSGSHREPRASLSSNAAPARRAFWKLQQNTQTDKHTDIVSDRLWSGNQPATLSQPYLTGPDGAVVILINKRLGAVDWHRQTDKTDRQYIS